MWCVCVRETISVCGEIDVGWSGDKGCCGGEEEGRRKQDTSKRRTPQLRLLNMQRCNFRGNTVSLSEFLKSG